MIALRIKTTEVIMSTEKPINFNLISEKVNRDKNGNNGNL